MIVRVTHHPDRPGIWVATGINPATDLPFTQEAPATSLYFPPAILDATRSPGAAVYYEATMDDIGSLIFGAPSTLADYEGPA
jgi:hypothetical protein